MRNVSEYFYLTCIYDHFQFMNVMTAPVHGMSSNNSAMCFCLSHRPSRNLSEKKRRDKLNVYISELAAMVPSCASAQRKLDKTTVLKMTVAYMKVHNGKIHYNGNVHYDFEDVNVLFKICWQIA